MPSALVISATSIRRRAAADHALPERGIEAISAGDWSVAIEAGMEMEVAHTERTLVQGVIVLEQRLTRKAVCGTLWDSFCGPGISLSINGLPVGQCPTRPRCPTARWRGLIPPAWHCNPVDPVQAHWLDRDPEVGDDGYTLRECSLT